MRGLVAAALLLTGCDRVFATLHVEDRPDAPLDAAVDVPIDSACITATYGKNGAGGAGLFSMCLTETPQAAYSLPATLDTSGTLCTYTVPQTVPGSDDLCVIVAKEIYIDTITRAVGTHPLVLLATDTISISGTLDGGSMRGTSANGAGANDPKCPAAALKGGAGSILIYGGGGAGGTFQTSGGSGGSGNAGTTLGGQPGGAGAALTYVRGGCRGGNGGDGDSASSGGGGGASGGALYLIAGTSVVLTSTGIVNASAEGGGGGAQGASSGQAGGGGGGGGSGGLIGIDAPMIVLANNARLVANGGGGGGSGPKGGTGANGNNGLSAMPTASYPFTAAGGLTDSPGGAGADQVIRNGVNGTNGSDTQGGGGGGGGLGFIQLYSPAITNSGALASPALN